MSWTTPVTANYGDVYTQTWHNNEKGPSGDMGMAWHDVGYSEFTTAVTVTATTEGTAQTLASVAVTVGSTYVVEFFAPSLNSGGRSTLTIALFRSGSSLGSIATYNNKSTKPDKPGYALYRGSTSGSYTFSVRAYHSVSDPAWIISVGAGNTGLGEYCPGYIRVIQQG